MKKIALLIGALAACAQPGLAGLCAPGSLASYIALGPSGCTVGGDVFSNFQPLSGISLTNLISPASVTVTPSVSGNNVSLTFGANAGVQANTIDELIFNYKVVGSVSGSMITLTNTAMTVDGLATDIQNLCAGGSFGSDGVSGCTGSAFQLLVVGSGSDQTVFAPATALSVTDDFTLDGGSMGSATGGTIVDQFTGSSSPANAPEPNTVLISGMGVLSLAWFRRRALANLCKKTKESL